MSTFSSVKVLKCVCRAILPQSDFYWIVFTKAIANKVIFTRRCMASAKQKRNNLSAYSGCSVVVEVLLDEGRKRLREAKRDRVELLVGRARVGMVLGASASLASESRPRFLRVKRERLRNEGRARTEGFLVVASAMGSSSILEKIILHVRRLDTTTS